MKLRSFLFISLALFAQASAHSESAIDASQYETLQAAVDAIPSAGGVLHIPAGKYEITQPLRIKTDDTRIVGVGAATHIINQNTDGQPAILIENSAFIGKPTPTKERLWRVNIADLRVTGNDKSGAGIEARYIEEIFIQGVTSSYHGGDGLKLYYCYEDPRIIGNLFTYNKKAGLHIEGCHDIIVSANQFEENHDGVRCVDAFNLAMSGNNLDDHLGDGIVIENTYGSVVASNMIEECQGWAVVLDRSCYGTTISANVIAHDFAGGIDLRDAHGCAISANTFTIVKNAAIAVRENSASITVSANNFSDTWIGNDSDGEPMQKRSNESSKTEANPNEATGILLQNCQAIVISGNLFSRLSTESVRQERDCKNILINSNVSTAR